MLQNDDGCPICDRHDLAAVATHRRSKALPTSLCLVASWWTLCVDDHRGGRQGADSFQRRLETESGFWGGNRMPTRSMSSLQSGVIAATPVRRNEVARMCAVLARSPIGLRDQKSQNKFRSNLRRAASEPRRRNDINLDPILRRLDIAKPTGRNHAFGGVDLIRVKRFRTVTRD